MEQYLAMVTPSSAKRWNVVMVQIESLRSDQLQVYGGIREVMPAIERLAHESRVFTNAYVQASHSNYAERNPQYLASVRACLQSLQRSGTPAFVKCHPRQTGPVPLGDAAHGVAEIARTIPVECLWLLLRDRPVQVIGGMSTSLLTAALLMPQARVRALPNRSGSGDTWGHELLRALRITTWVA